jgi:hypothetical protein
MPRRQDVYYRIKEDLPGFENLEGRSHLAGAHPNLPSPIVILCVRRAGIRALGVAEATLSGPANAKTGHLRAPLSVEFIG